MTTPTNRFPPGRGSQLTPADRAEIQSLSLIDGLSQSKIAERTGRDRETVRNVLTAADTKALAEQMATEAKDAVVRKLRLAAPLMADHWLKAAEVATEKGDHRPARDALLHAGAIEPIADARQSGGARVQLVIGMPGCPVSVDIPGNAVEGADRLVIDASADDAS